MKKLLIILSLLAAFTSANAQIWWAFTNFSSYNCEYHDGYQSMTLSPGMSSMGYYADAVLPTRWHAQYVGSAGICSTGGTHSGPIEPTHQMMSSCDDARVYVVYCVYHDLATDSYSISVEFHDR